MNPDEKFHNSQLILMVLDGSVTDAQFSEFNKKMREDAAFRSHYLSIAEVNAALNSLDKYPAGRPEEEETLSPEFWHQMVAGKS